jgi:hypothetical protein
MQAISFLGGKHSPIQEDDNAHAHLTDETPKSAVLFLVLLIAAPAYVRFALLAQAGPMWVSIELSGAAMYGAIGWRGLGPPYTVLTHSQFQLAISIEALSWASR